jgi:hypothetical protein
MSAPLSRILATCALALCACSTNTRIVSSWHEPDATRLVFKKVLVVAIVRLEDRRRAVEDRMVADIGSRGVLAVPSYKLVTAADAKDLEALKAAMVGGNFDGAVVWRTLGVKTEAHYIPAGRPTLMMNPGFWGYYNLGWSVEQDPATVQTERTVSVEITVYRVTRDTDTLVWTGNSETFDPTSLASLVDGVVDAGLSSMRHDGLFASRQ